MWFTFYVDLWEALRTPRASNLIDGKVVRRGHIDVLCTVRAAQNIVSYTMFRMGKGELKHWEELRRHLGKEKVVDLFPTEEDCEELLFQSIWQLGYSCPKCGFEGDIWRLKTRRMYQCPSCLHQYSSKSASRLYRKRASLLSCFKGAEYIIVTMAKNRPSLITIDVFSRVVGLSYRPARTLRMEMYEELKKPMGGFWGNLICTDEVNEGLYIGDRFEDLLEDYGLADHRGQLPKLGG